MKKLLACGLILSTLMSCGSVCFAMENGHRCANEFMFSIGGKKGDGDKNNKAPKPPKTHEEETKAEKRRKAKQQFKDLKDQAIALLSGYYEEGYGLIWYTTRELPDMKIGDLSKDYTVLKAADVEKQLPQVVSETLKEYLELREELYPETMMEHHPLFISNVYGRQTEFVSAMYVCQCAKKGRKQLNIIFPGLTFTSSKEVQSTITKLRDKAMVDLSCCCKDQGFFDSFVDLYEALSDMKICDVDWGYEVLTVAGQEIELPQQVMECLWDYIENRTQYFPETIEFNSPLFIDCQSPKKALPLTGNSIQRIVLYR